MEKNKKILAALAVVVVAIIVVVAAMGLGGSNQRDNKEGWFVATLWSPHWAFEQMALEYLEDPEAVFGGVEVVETIARDGFAEANPRAYAIIKSFNWTQADIESVMYGIFVENKADRVAAQDWVDANPAAVQSWIDAGEGLSEGNGDVLRFGYVLWDGEIASTNVLTLVLEEAGFDVEMVSVDAGPLYQGLSQGSLDFTTSAWLPITHESYIEQYGDSLDRVSVNLEGVKIGLAVPKYVYDAGVHSIADLKNYISEFAGIIDGIEPGAGVVQAAERSIDVYGLDGFEVQTSSSGAMFAQLKSMYLDDR